MTKPTAYPKRLIEVDLPIKRISAHARNEKDSRLGHIPRLHIYPAARPAAACRAVICAALWPDPAPGKADSPCPAGFIDLAKREMLAWTTHDRQVLLSEESRPRFEAARRNPKRFDDPLELRLALLDFIADFANWDSSTVPEYLATSQALTRAAHYALGGAPGTKPLVVDPFAGGGAIPLEALRVGTESYASDLNPLAVLLNKVILEYIPKYGQRLADEVRKWSAWIKQEAEKELAEFYPTDKDGATPIAYLWARTILSEAPGSGKYPVEIPMIRSMWLTRGRSEGDWALRWVLDESRKPKTEIVTVTFADGIEKRVKRPVLEVFRPKQTEEVPAGTIRGGSVVCPVTGYTTPVKRVRVQLSARNGGTRDARLYCVVTASDKEGRAFRTSTPLDLKVAEMAATALSNRFGSDDVPHEPLPPDGTNGFRVQKYGIEKWEELYTHRQTLALVTYAKLIRKYVDTGTTPKDINAALEAVLALLLNRLADLNASLCVWQLNTPNTAHVFGRWALPMVFDFGEVNPLARAGGSPESATRRSLACIDELVSAKTSVGTAVQQSATRLNLPDDIASAVITDPPYYDAIPYSDLLDFFAVWMNRVCKRQALSFNNGLSPKDEECVVDKSKGRDHVYFQKTMTECMSEARRILDPSGIAVVVFAHKSTAGWEAQLEALINAGLTVSASWPIDTEMGSRLRAKGSAALASSVHLICRPRENPDGSLRTDDVGDWRDVLAELPKRIHDWMPRLAEEGVVGADAIFACLGPALEVFSRYSRVEKPSGETVTLKEYLTHVWAAIAREALNMIFAGADATGFEEDARLTAMWLWTLSTNVESGESSAKDADDDEDEESSGKGKNASGYVLEYDAARKIAQGLGAHLEDLTHTIEVMGEKARLLPVAERTRHLFGKDEADAPKKKKKRDNQLTFKNFEQEVDEAAEEGGWGEKTAPKAGITILDRVHQAMILFAAGRGEAMKRFLVEEGIGNDGRFWKLAQALSALYPAKSDEKRWVDGVLARKKGLGF